MPTKGKIKGFADDTAVLYNDFDNNDTESDASIITEYFRINKLILNINKSVMMIFKTNFPNDNPSLMFNGVQIKSLESTKYIGLHIDSLLKFKTHNFVKI